MKKRKVRCKLKCILRKYTPTCKSSRLYGFVTHYKLWYVTYLHKSECFFSNFLKLKSVTASKPLQNNKRITSSCFNNHKITKSTSSTKRHCVSRMKLLTSGDIELNPDPGCTTFKQSVYIVTVGFTMLLNLWLRQLGLRPVDVAGEGDCFSDQFLISYMVIPIITYSSDKLVFNILAITLNVLLKAILRIHGMNI